MCDFHMGAACNCGVDDVLSKVELVKPDDKTRFDLEFFIGNMVASIISNGPGMDIRRYAVELADAIDDRIKVLIDTHIPRKPR